MPDLYALAEALDLTPDEADELAEAFAAERQRGRDEGALRAFKSVAGANGSTQGVLAVLKGTFDESKHKRDHGKFSSTGGGTDRTTDSGDEKPAKTHESKPAARTDQEHPADAKTRTLIARIADVPRAVREKVTSFILNKYRTLAERYGETGAKAILAGVVMLTPIPVPGTSLLPIAIAEAVSRIRRAIGGVAQKALMSLDDADIAEEARALLEEIYAHMGEAVPEPEPVEKAFDESQVNRDEEGKFAKRSAPLSDAQRDALRSLRALFPDGIGHLLDDDGHVDHGHTHPEAAGHREAADAHREAWHAADKGIDALIHDRLPAAEDVVARVAALNAEVDTALAGGDLSFDPDEFRDHEELKVALEDLSAALDEIAATGGGAELDALDTDPYWVTPESVLPEVETDPDQFEAEAEAAREAAAEHESRRLELAEKVADYERDAHQLATDWRAETRAAVDRVRGAADAAVALPLTAWEDGYGRRTKEGWDESDAGYAKGVREVAHQARDRAAALLAKLDGTVGKAGGTVSKAAHKYACAYVRLPDDVGDRLKALAAMIPDRDLGDDGREDEPHVTVLYGLHGGDPKEIAAAVAGFGPVRLRLGAVSIFAGTENGKDYDVLKVEVDSLDLHDLRARLMELPHTSTHPTYKPHATIAYVKAGKGAKYAEMMGAIDGADVVVSEMVFSDCDGTKTTLPLWELVGKAVDPDQPDDTDPDDTDLYDDPDAPDDANALLLTALVGAVHDAAENGDDPEAAAERFRPYFDDAGLLAEALSDDVLKAWDHTLHPRDDFGKFVSRDAIHDAKTALAAGDSSKADALREKVTGEIEREKLDDALAGKSDLGRTQAHKQREAVATRREDKAKTKARANELIKKIAHGQLQPVSHPFTPDDLHALADHLPHMTVADLRRARSALEANFGGDRRKEQMVERLKAHALGMREGLINEGIAAQYAGLKPGALFSRERQLALSKEPDPSPLPGKTGWKEPEVKPRSFQVGEPLLYTGKIGTMPAEFRGLFTDPASGRKMARVIVRPEMGPPFETSVSTEELSREQSEQGEKTPDDRNPSSEVGSDSRVDGRAQAEARTQEVPASEAKEDWRAELTGKKRWQAVEILRQREPHELTRDEYLNLKTYDHEDFGKGDNTFAATGLRGGGENVKKQEKEQYQQHLERQWATARDDAFIAGKPVSQRPPWAVAASEYTTTTGNDADDHREVVKDALAAGKPVPAEVLADYPDLAAKHATPTAEPSRAAATSTALAGTPTGGASGGWMPGASTGRKVGAEPAHPHAELAKRHGRAIRGDGKSLTYPTHVGHGKRADIERRGVGTSVGDVFHSKRTGGPMLVTSVSKPRFVSDDYIEDASSHAAYPDGAGWYADYTAVPVHETPAEATGREAKEAEASAKAKAAAEAKRRGDDAWAEVSGHPTHHELPAGVPNDLKWEQVSADLYGSHGHGTRRHVATLPDGTRIGRTSSSSYDDHRESYHLPSHLTESPEAVSAQALDRAKWASEMASRNAHLAPSAESTAAADAAHAEFDRLAGDHHTRFGTTPAGLSPAMRRRETEAKQHIAHYPEAVRTIIEGHPDAKSTLAHYAASGEQHSLAAFKDRATEVGDEAHADRASKYRDARAEWHPKIAAEFGAAAADKAAQWVESMHQQHAHFDDPHASLEGEYDTLKEERAKKEATAAKRAANKADKMVVVSGNTFPHRDALGRIPGAKRTSEGGKWVWRVPAAHAGKLPKGLRAG